MTILVISGTTRCNLECKHCFRQRYTEPVDLPLDLFKNILEQSLKYKIEHIGLTGGEMTLHPEFKEYIETIHNTGIGYSLVSNGVNWDKIKHILFPNSETMRYIAFSLDGNKETHDWLRGDGSYNKVVHAIQEASVFGFHTRACMVIGKHNINQIEEVALKDLALGCHELVFSTILPTLYNNKMVLNLKEKKEVHERILDLRNQLRTNVIISADFVAMVGLPHCCTIDGSNITIDPWGNLCACCELEDYTRKDVENRPEVICSLKEETLDEGMSLYLDWITNFKKWKIRQMSFLANIYEEDSCFMCLRYVNNGIKEKR